MTSVIMIAPLNAQNFESGNATDGQVLTADGAGGSAFEDAAGGLISVDPKYTMIISGAGTEIVNYATSIIGSNQLGSIYYNGMSGVTISKNEGRFGALWIISVGETNYYTSSDDVITPDLVTTWVVDQGTLPVPTVAAESGYYPDGQPLVADGGGGYMWQKINETSIDSSNATDGQVLTADGAGGAEWREPAGGGGGSGIPYLGNVGQPDTNATGAELSAAYEDVTGSVPQSGAVATLIDNGGPEFALAVYDGNQGVWWRVNYSGAYP